MVRAKDAGPAGRAYNGGLNPRSHQMPFTSPISPPASPSRRTALLLAALAVVVSLLAARPAFAADTFVDQAAGNNSNDCLSAASACLTIAGPTGGVAKAGAGDDVHVAPGTYMESVALDAGKSLRATGAVAATIIASPAIEPAITATGGGGTIEGFTIRAPSATITEVRLEATAT